MKHLANMKEKNKKRILKAIHKNKKVSKKKLASQLELSSSVMTKLCNELSNDYLIVELKKAENSGVGRKEVLMGINHGIKKIVGVSINHRETKIILSDMQPEIIDSIVFKTDLNSDKYREKLAMKIKQILNENIIKPKEVLGVGLSLKGITDGENSLVGIWGKKVEFKNYLETELGISTVLDNGVRCSALLENFNSGEESFVLIKYVQAGIGGAIMKNEELVYGDNNKIAEIGHIIVDPSKDYCKVCKRKGCLESIISYEKMIENAKLEFSIEETPVLYEICEGRIGDVSIDTILAAAKDGSIKMNKLLRKSASKFAIAIINTYSIVDTNRIVLTGKIFQNEIFVEYLKSFIFEYQFDNLWNKIRISELKEYPLAPAVLVLNKLFFN